MLVVVTQLVEYHVANVAAAGSSPVYCTQEKENDMFTLKIVAGTGGTDAEIFAGELAEVVQKTTGVAPKGATFRL